MQPKKETLRQVHHPQKRPRTKNKPLMMRGKPGWRWVAVMTHPSQSKAPLKDARGYLILVLLSLTIGIVFGSEVPQMFFICLAISILLFIPCCKMYNEASRREAQQKAKLKKSGTPGTKPKKKRK